MHQKLEHEDCLFGEIDEFSTLPACVEPLGVAFEREKKSLLLSLRNSLRFEVPGLRENSEKNFTRWKLHLNP